MKKKRLLTALVSILMIFVIAGCSNSGDSNQTAAASNNNGNGGNANWSGFQKPDVYGEISAIDGNKVTLKLLEIPQMSRRNGQNGGKGRFTGGGSGGNGGPVRGGMRARKYTGEVKSFVIPDGVSITTMTWGQNGMTQN
ncbi:MAG: hypothetical protein Q8898_14305, partial [Bacillota bacterium]|nr:hypothetical protein [Bacillota bacterium]